MNDLSYKSLVGKKVKVRSNSSGDPFVTIGKDYTLYKYLGNSMYKLHDPLDPSGAFQQRPNMYYQDFDIIDNVVNSEIKGFVKKKILPNEKDSFGIEGILELKEDEETIYISASARNILEVKAGDAIGVAIDYDKNTVYIFKETENEAGIIISDDNTIKSLSIYRDLVNYLFSKIVSVNPTKINNPEYPDNVFYQLTRYDVTLKNKFKQMISLGNEVMNGGETSMDEINSLVKEVIIEKKDPKKKKKEINNHDNYGGFTYEVAAKTPTPGLSDYLKYLDDTTEEKKQNKNSIYELKEDNDTTYLKDKSKVEEF